MAQLLRGVAEDRVIVGAARRADERVQAAGTRRADLAACEEARVDVALRVLVPEPGRRLRLEPLRQLHLVIRVAAPEPLVLVDVGRTAVEIAERGEAPGPSDCTVVGYTVGMSMRGTPAGQGMLALNPQGS